MRRPTEFRDEERLIRVAVLRHDGADGLKLDVEVAFRLAQGIGVALAAFNPELITLGTTAYYAGDLMLRPLMHYLPRFTWSEFSGHCVIALSGLGLRIGELAGASVAFNTLYERGQWRP